MKRLFKRTSVILAAIVSLSAALVSCDGAAWAEILLPVISELLKPTNGYQNTIQFSGTANLEMYNYNTSNNTYDKDSRQTAKVSTVASISYNDSICQIQMTDLSVGTQKVSNVDFVTYFESTTNTISPNEDYLTGGICTFNGTANTALDAACFTGKITNQNLNLTTIYFTIGNKLFKGTFQGTQMQQ